MDRNNKADGYLQHYLTPSERHLVFSSRLGLKELPPFVPLSPERNSTVCKGGERPDVELGISEPEKELAAAHIASMCPQKPQPTSGKKQPMKVRPVKPRQEGRMEHMLAMNHTRWLTRGKLLVRLLRRARRQLLRSAWGRWIRQMHHALMRRRSKERDLLNLVRVLQHTLLEKNALLKSRALSHWRMVGYKRAHQGRLHLFYSVNHVVQRRLHVVRCRAFYQWRLLIYQQQHELLRSLLDQSQNESLPLDLLHHIPPSNNQSQQSPQQQSHSESLFESAFSPLHPHSPALPPVTPVRSPPPLPTAVVHLSPSQSLSLSAQPSPALQYLSCCAAEVIN
jgi:hypothetical protein